MLLSENNKKKRMGKRKRKSSSVEHYFSDLEANKKVLLSMNMVSDT